MIEYRDVEQGSDEWRRLRLGRPTASCFGEIVTPKGKFSEQSRKYMFRLLAEDILGFPVDQFTNKWMQRGSDLESEAVRAYEFLREVDTEKIGFVTTDDGRIGASPDRMLVGANGLLEIKCPQHSTHVGYMLTLAAESDYKPQLQGQLLITEREFVDIVSYCPQLPSVVIRVQRDEEYIAILKDALESFCDILAQKRMELEQRYGPFVQPVKESAAEVIDVLGISDADVEMIWQARASAQT